VTHSALSRAEAFASTIGIRVPILLAPMAGACPPTLSTAVANAGGLGSCGALLMSPDAIRQWTAQVRTKTNGPFNLNLWIPDPAPVRDQTREANVRAFLGKWGPSVPETAGDATPPDFTAQCEAFLEATPAIISSVMGLYPAPFVKRMKAKGIKWFANVSTVTEALNAEAAGADVIVAQGMEAGGHRGCFDAAMAEAGMVGLFSLLPAVVDAVKVPVVATGGIADARGVAAALLLGASAAQIGTGFLRSPEAGLPAAWADAIGNARPEGTIVSRVFSGRAGRSIATAYALAATSSGAPVPAPYPVQRALTQAMRDAGTKFNDIDRMQAWAGQSGRMARVLPAAIIVDELWTGAKALLR
jgi:nitronate monooxygenase